MADADTKKKPEESGQYRWLVDAGIYCDHYSAQAINKNNVVRMAFGEYVGREYYPIYRTAVVMPLADVKSLVKTLQEIIEEASAREAQANASTKDPSAK